MNKKTNKECLPGSYDKNDFFYLNELVINVNEKSLITHIDKHPYTLYLCKPCFNKTHLHKMKNYLHSDTLIFLYNGYCDGLNCFNPPDIFCTLKALSPITELKLYETLNT